MTANLTLALLIGVLFGSGVVLLMSRGIVRAFLGVLLISNGINLMFVVAAGPPGRPPIVPYPSGDETGISDPLPQALVLTAIVITLALTGFVLALADRSWQLSRTDDVADDLEATRIGLKAQANDTSDSDYAADPIDEDEDPDPGACYHPDCPAPATAPASDHAGHDIERDDR
ncbi:multicomponent Na+:H+ antiporter subunit C [Kineosphaera limosa]|uniref:Na(+)/H(+) antiporter subunit C n=1 Tax=Kineosphaera limosa NBRC 100340 TaxID=1184609 RepID=K6VF72_9MICO|nr:Na(+)/H(+) antiporter subunit C [Kineosphaera limosa]NYD98867.1 multicomponent Na+:H+ antiporter subunit C [Kineosphaera limosa]GAB94808.1 Na(+)/H(+) antiporter subunit C [Kineosphaera limosa NBRC 100340]